MTLKEELEILRGEPIEVFTGDPMDIPCIETSDPGKLCKNPIVSVHMITYNHEPYIRQAIEGVMMQKTDFEFELVIGEDCSQDKTREICFEYQKKFPDKIRILWWHENVSKLGGNGRRVRARCRGDFIALCEGDDYWVDPLKLQKQVDVMRKHQNIGLCFTNANVLWSDASKLYGWDGASYYAEGVVRGKDFFDLYCYGKNPRQKIGPEGFIMTASCVVRKSILQRARKFYDIFQWKLLLGDKTLWLAMSLLGDVYYLSDITTVYRRHQGGAMGKYSTLIYRDSSIIKIYFSTKIHYNKKVPLSIVVEPIHALLNKADKGDAIDWDKVIKVVRLLIRKYNFSTRCLSLGQRMKWLAFLWLGNAKIFKISKMTFGFK